MNVYLLTIVFVEAMGYVLTLPDGIKFENGICKMFGHSNKEIAIR